jgi:uncharacterized damage-inducible protein DinB
MKQYFQKLYEYNAWCNKRVLDALRRQKVDDEKILSLMSHVVVAQFLWLHRIEGLAAPNLQLWGKYTLTEIEPMAREISDRWISFVNHSDDFTRELKYLNYTGDAFTNSIEHIMIHVVNHGTYHRGQVATLLRQAGYEPVNTDFITYDRVITGQLTLND